MGELDGKVVAVTGTSQGIGVGIVERCLEAGASVLGISRRGTDGGVDAAGYQPLALDVASDGAPDRALKEALDRFGRVDALVNNAAILLTDNCWEIRDEDWSKMLAVNLTAPFLLAQAFARHWRDRGSGGTVVNICSVESDVGWPDPPQAGYATTKGALLALTRGFAYDLAESRIRCVAVAPGAIATELGDDRDSVVRRIPLGRFGTPAEIGDAVAFLVSDRASYVTGEIFYVDGGYRLR